MTKTAPAPQKDLVTIEIVQNPKCTSKHQGRELKPGERVQMRRDKAERHVTAGNASIVTGSASA